MIVAITVVLDDLTTAITTPSTIATTNIGEETKNKQVKVSRNINFNLIMELFLLPVKQPPNLKKLPKKVLEKEKMLSDKFQEEVIPVMSEPQQEIFSETKVFEPYFGAATGEAKGESIGKCPERSKLLP